MSLAQPSSPRARLLELGVVLPEVAAPVGTYSPAVRVGDLLWTSGQLPFVAGVLPSTGKVGREVTPEVARQLARTAALNALAVVHAELGSLDGVRRIVKLVVYVASEASFTGQSAVANGASELLVDIFASFGRPARSAVGVAVLPLDSPVELEIVVHTA